MAGTTIDKVLNNSSRSLSPHPTRIISLVPSQTELLYDLGLDEEVAGITKFCIHPTEWFKSKKRVGGTKTVNVDLIRSLHPDLILANKEENVKEQIEELSSIAPVYVSDITNLDHAVEMIEDIGWLTDTTKQSAVISNRVQNSFDDLAKLDKSVDTAYFIWRNPYMSAGGDTFINDIMSRCGMTNVAAATQRYPEIKVVDNDLFLEGKILSPTLLLLSSEPYPFKQKHIDELTQHLPNTQILMVDGEMFSWYGSRLLKAVPYLQQLINTIKSAW